MQRKEILFMAKVADRAERYDDLLDRILQLFDLNVELDPFEMNLVQRAFDKAINPKMSSWRIINSVEVEDPALQPLIKDYSKKVAEELNILFNRMIKSFEERSIDPKLTTADKFFYLAFNCKCYGYLCEISEKEEAVILIDKTYQIYSAVYESCITELRPFDLKRLNLAYDFSVFCYQQMKMTEKAIQISDRAFTEGTNFGDLPDDLYREITLILQRLRDNSTIWSGEESGDIL